MNQQNHNNKKQGILNSSIHNLNNNTPDKNEEKLEDSKNTVDIN